MADRYQPYNKDQSRTLSRAGSPMPSTKSTKSILGRSIRSIGKKTKSSLAGALAAVKHKGLEESVWAAAVDEPSKGKEEGGFRTADQVVPTSQPEEMEIGDGFPPPTNKEIQASLFGDNEDKSSDEEEEEEDLTPQVPKISTPPKNLATLQDPETTPQSLTIVKLTEAELYALKVTKERSGKSPDPFTSSQPANTTAFIQNIEVSKTLTKHAPNAGMDVEPSSPIPLSSPIPGYESFTLDKSQVKDVLEMFMDMWKHFVATSPRVITNASDFVNPVGKFVARFITSDWARVPGRTGKSVLSFLQERLSIVPQENIPVPPKPPVKEVWFDTAMVVNTPAPLSIDKGKVKAKPPHPPVAPVIKQATPIRTSAVPKPIVPIINFKAPAKGKSTHDNLSAGKVQSGPLPSIRSDTQSSNSIEQDNSSAQGKSAKLPPPPPVPYHTRSTPKGQSHDAPKRCRDDSIYVNRKDI